MSRREIMDTASPADNHTAAANAFVEHVHSRYDTEISKLYIFGSTARDETRGLASDVDVLVVLNDTTDQQAVANNLRDLAYDIMLEYGPVVELHIFSESEFEHNQNRGNPFVQNVINEGKLYA